MAATEAMDFSAHKHVNLNTRNDVDRIEAPVTVKAYLMCAFATFGGIFFGYDSGYINGVSGSTLFITAVEGQGATALSSSHQSLIVSILSCGTFFGQLRQYYTVFSVHILTKPSNPRCAHGRRSG